MSLNLYMEPVKPPEATCLGGHPLKGLICSGFGEHDGSLKEDILLDRSHLPILRVLVRTHDRGQQADEIREGLEQIIDAIEQHGAVHLYTDV